MKLTIKNIERMNFLIKECKKYSGPRLPKGHGLYSYCSTYDDRFIEASAELWQIYYDAGAARPEEKMSEYFIKNDIPNTAKTAMTIPNAKYLYDTHLKPIVMQNLRTKK